MADDITLTVRVRDMTRGDFARLNGQLHRMQASMQGVNRTTATAGRNAQMAGRDMAQLSSRIQAMQRTGSMTRREFDQMSSSLNLMTRSMRSAARAGEVTRTQFRNFSRDARLMGARMTVLARDGDVFNRMSARLILFQDHVRRTTSHMGLLRRQLGRAGSFTIGGLAAATAGVSRLVLAMKALGGSMMANKRYAAILIGVLLLIGPVAVALGALLVAVLGGAFIALGAFALKGSQQVRSAFTGMKDTVAASVKAAAAPMQQDLVNAIGAVGTAVVQMQPALQQAFAATGPLIGNLSGAFTDLAAGALPGIVEALQRMGPAIEGFRIAMGMVGQGFGDMFAAMTKGGGADALRDTWLTLGVELKNLLVGIGEFINMATQSGTATLLMVGVFRSLSGILNIVETGLRAVDSLFGGLPGTIAEMATSIGDLGVDFGAIGDALDDSNGDIEEMRTQLKGVNAEIKAMEVARAKVPGPAKDQLTSASGDSYNQLLVKRDALTRGISMAEKAAAADTERHGRAVKTLAQAIRDLNQETLSRFDAQAGMENAIATATENANKFTGAIRIQNGVFDLTHEKSRKVYEDFSKVATGWAESVKQAEAAHAPVSEINALWERGATQLLALGAAYKLPKGEAQAFIDTVMMTPERKRTLLEVESKQAQAAAEAAKEKINSVPANRRAALVLEAQRAIERAAIAKSQLDAFDGRVATATIVVNQFKTTTIKTIEQYQKEFLTGRSQHDITGATGGLFTGSSFRTRGFAGGGPVRGPGSGTSDDVYAPWLSNGEFVIKAASVRENGEKALQALNDGKLKLGPTFSKGGKYRGKRHKDGVSAEMLAERRSILGSMQISAMARMTGSKRNSLEKQFASPESVNDLINTINEWRNKIKKATSGNVEKHLLGVLTRQGNALVKQEMKLLKVNKALDGAQDKLRDLKDKATQLAENIKDSVLKSSDITEGVEKGKGTSTGNILAKLQTSQRRASEFDQMLKTLRKRGLGGTALNEIGDAGLEGGGFETAKALMKAGSGDLKRINTLKNQIATSGGSIGKTVADGMYAAGIKAAEGIVKGLQKQQAKINASMLALTGALERALRRALGRKATGGIVGAAGGGARGGMTLVGEHGPEIVNLPFGSTVRSNPDSRRIASGGGGGGQVIEVVVNLDGRTIARQIVDPLRAEIWHRSGGNVQKALGRGSAA